MRLFNISNNWSDLGYLLGLSGVMGFTLHWSHFITVVVIMILTIAMKVSGQVTQKDTKGKINKNCECGGCGKPCFQCRTESDTKAKGDGN